MANNRYVSIFLFLLAFIAFAAAIRYVQTTVVFSVDTAISFTVFTLGGGGNFTTSKTSVPGNFTESFYFNTTNPDAEWVAPCAAADNTNCQSGPNQPAYRIRNTGNTNLTMQMNLSVATPAYVKLCANSTKTTNCPQTVIAACDMSGAKGNLNATSWLNITSNLGWNSPCYETNVTLYATYTTATVADPQTSVLTINATQS
ncbi:MAG TPA: hypothetical protein VJI13_02375 [Candidatus Norongarragalinales archaeon]|nr:hypothetical protein [Candidatus Norongarragalinales archaeon]